jgi:hypothetical protein
MTIGAAARALPAEDIFRLAVVLSLPVIGLEQVVHTSPTALVNFPVYEALHWLSDSLLALPLAVAAVWSGVFVAYLLGNRRQALADLIARAGAIVLIFALLLVPGAVLHEEADRLTHAHAGLAIHTHGAGDVKNAEVVPAVFAFSTHALGDGLTGQLLGFPIVILALWLHARSRRRAGLAGTTVRARDGPAATPGGVTTQLGGERRT